MLGAQGIRATGFKRAQGNAHCAKFESHTNRVTFETNAIRMTSSVQALCIGTFVFFNFMALYFFCDPSRAEGGPEGADRGPAGPDSLRGPPGARASEVRRAELGPVGPVVG